MDNCFKKGNTYKDSRIWFEYKGLYFLGFSRVVEGICSRHCEQANQRNNNSGETEETIFLMSLWSEINEIQMKMSTSKMRVISATYGSNMHPFKGLKRSSLKTLECSRQVILFLICFFYYLVQFMHLSTRGLQLYLPSKIVFSTSVSQIADCNKKEGKSVTAAS